MFTIFPETYCNDKAYAQTAHEEELCLDNTPNFTESRERVNDKENGVYSKAEHVSGDIAFLMTREK